MIKIISGILCFFFLLITVGSGNAQTLVPKKCYMHLVGTINKEYLLEMNLVKLSDTIYGDYYFIQPGKMPSGWKDKSKTIAVSGRMNTADAFTLKETGNASGSSFTGKFLNGQSLSGSFEDSPENSEMPFDLTERYPEGSVPMNAYYLKAFMPLVKKQNGPAAEIQLGMLLPGESANPLIYDSLKQILLVRFSGKPVRISDPNKVMDGIRMVYFENYLASNEGIYTEEMSASFNWQSFIFVHVLMNSGHLLTLYTDHSAFTGGAHSLQTRQFTVFSLWSGKEISLKYLFGENNEPALSELITQKIRELKGLTGMQSLKDAGFYAEEIKPSDNFYISREGIGFFYNQYDIASYETGTVDVLFPFAELKKVLVNTGVLRDIIK